MPRRPLEPKLNMTAPVEDAMVRGFIVDVPVIERLEPGVEEPIPTLAFAITFGPVAEPSI